MERRSFLKLLAAGAASATFPSIVRAETLGLNGKIAPSNRIALGYIGVGSQGGSHFRTDLHNPQFQTNGICDVDATRVQKALGELETAYAEQRQAGSYKGCFTTGDFRELLARPDIDAVWISVPDHWHAMPVIHAARAGKDIYAEKPLALTISEGQAMVRAVEESGVVCQIGSQQRSQANFQRVVQLVRNGFLGKITGVHVHLPSGAGAQLKAPMAPQQVPEGFDYECGWVQPPTRPITRNAAITSSAGRSIIRADSSSDWIGHHFDIAAWAIGVNRPGPWRSATRAPPLPPARFTTPRRTIAFEAHYANGVVINVASNAPQRPADRRRERLALDEP